MTKFTCEYGFDELKIRIANAMTGLFYGKASLVEDSNPGEFYVEWVYFDDNGARLYRHGNSVHMDDFSRELFRRIAQVIESDSHAAEFFAAELAASREPDPDYLRDRRRDDALHFA
jgi:hypothetical protein